jgi:glycosyltransferase involved in cell wall biosynthesis
MKVLGIVTFRIFPTHMGGQKGVALFYQYLSEYVEVLLAGSNDNQDSGKIKMERVLFPNRQIYRNGWRIGAIKKIAIENSIDLIVAEHSYAGWIAWLASKRLRKPFIIHSHNIESSRFRQMHKWWWPLYRRYEAWIHRKADHNFFISEDDLRFAVKKFKLNPQSCTVVSYGVEATEINKDKAAIRKTLKLHEDETIFLFNGTLDYKPNHDAVVDLCEKIQPLLRNRLPDCRIIVTGNRAPAGLIKKMMQSGIHYLGYVKNLPLYYQTADLFLNPVSNDTGVKTKVIEAIANNCTVLSTASGAKGIMTNMCGEKLMTVPDGDWNIFVDIAIKAAKTPTVDTPPAFYEYYSWKNMAARAASSMEELIRK